MDNATYFTTPVSPSIYRRLEAAERRIKQQAIYISQLEEEHRTLSLALGIDCPPAVTLRV